MSDSIPPPPLIVQPKANAIQEMTNVLREALIRLRENQANPDATREALHLTLTNSKNSLPYLLSS